jgi:hypothetical protein
MGLVLALSLWFVALLVASVSGWLGSLSPYSPPLLAGLTILISSVGYFLLPPVRVWFAGFGLHRLTAIHVLRIAAVPLFFWYGNRNLLPQSFVEAAGWGDLAAGLIALAVVIFWRSRAGYWTAHLLGMVDFISAFAIAIRLTLANPGAMHAITGLPMALIPFFGVGVLATIHVIAYDLLVHRRGLKAQGELRLSPLEAL